jgi:D-xylose transport system substrate-binding protein
MIHRRVLAFVSTFAILLLACSSPGGSAPAGSAPAGSGTACTVGVSWNNYAQPRWAKADEPAIQKAIQDAGGTYIKTDANDSSEQQLADIDSLINQGADALIILAKDPEAILPAVQKAKDAGIPVIGYDRLIEDEEAFYITFNNELVGTLMAEVIKGLVPEGNYVIIKGHNADPNADFLRGGMTKAGIPELDDDSGPIDVVYEDYTDNWDTTNARNNMDAALASVNNDVQAVLSENDSMATGVVAALEAVGLAGEVPVSGQDGDTPALNRVALGTQAVSVWKDAFGLGETAGNVAIQLCNGTALNAVTAPSTLKDHVKPDSPAAAAFTTPGGKTVQSIILKPTPITRENINLVVDLGWETKDAVCADVAAGEVDLCG